MTCTRIVLFLVLRPWKRKVVLVFSVMNEIFLMLQLGVVVSTVTGCMKRAEGISCVGIRCFRTNCFVVDGYKLADTLHVLSFLLPLLWGVCFWRVISVIGSHGNFPH